MHISYVAAAGVSLHSEGLVSWVQLMGMIMTIFDYSVIFSLVVFLEP